MRSPLAREVKVTVQVTSQHSIHVYQNVVVEYVGHTVFVLSPTSVLLASFGANFVKLEYTY